MKKTNDYYGTLYAGIAMNVKISEHYGTHMGCCNEWKKLATIMGPYMRVLQWMKNQWLLWDPICRYYNEYKNQRVLWDPYGVLQWMKKTSDFYGTLYVGIAMNEKLVTIMGPYMRYCNECKKSTTIIDPICKY
jgi:hypothetical protein